MRDWVYVKEERKTCTHSEIFHVYQCQYQSPEYYQYQYVYQIWCMSVKWMVMLRSLLCSATLFPLCVCMFAMEIDSVTYGLNECYLCEKWNMAQKSKSNVKQEWEKNVYSTHKHTRHTWHRKTREKEEEWKKQQSRNNCVCVVFDTIHSSMELYDINVQFAYKTR